KLLDGRILQIIGRHGQIVSDLLQGDEIELIGGRYRSGADAGVGGSPGHSPGDLLVAGNHAGEAGDLFHRDTGSAQTLLKQETGTGPRLPVDDTYARPSQIGNPGDPAGIAALQQKS